MKIPFPFHKYEKPLLTICFEKNLKEVLFIYLFILYIIHSYIYLLMLLYRIESSYKCVSEMVNQQSHFQMEGLWLKKYLFSCLRDLHMSLQPL